jgi:hypothetical protein
VQLLPVFVARKTVCQFLASRIAIHVFLGQTLSEVFATEKEKGRSD